MPRSGDATAFALAVLRTADEHNVRYPAAAFAYYGFVAFLPLLVLAVALLGEAGVGRLDQTLPQLLTPEVQRLVYESLAVASGRAGATVFAVAVLAWSLTNMTVAFQTVVERVEGGPTRPRRVQLRNAVGILASILLTVVAVVFTERFFAVVPASPFTWARPAVLLVALTVTFLPLYYLSSQRVTDLPGALPGALTAAVGWTALVTVVQLYAADAGQYALYGVLSGIILVYTSLYVAAGALMLGVVVNVTVEERADGGEPGR